MKNKYLAQLMTLLMAGMLTACGAIDTGEVGVRTTFTGKIIPEEIKQGFYTNLTSTVDVFSAKEIVVDLFDMKPKANDNLMLEDFDVEVYYQVDPTKVSDLHIKYADTHAESESGSVYPSYKLVRSMARNAVYATVSQYDSLTIHQKRDIIGDSIMRHTQSTLDATDAGVFVVTKVIVRDVKTDPEIEAAIQASVREQKLLEKKGVELDIARKQVEINQALTKSLTPEILREMELNTIREACQKSTCILGMNGNKINPLIQVK